MSFYDITKPVEFTAANNGSRSDTYQTDFRTGRSWVEPKPWLRYYKDGGVSLHSTGYRAPYVRYDATTRGIDIQTFGGLRGTLTTVSGEKVPRSALRTPPGTVLIEGDRVYPLKNWRRTGTTNPQTGLPPAQLLSSPIAVWQDRSMMPVCSTIHIVHMPSKNAHDKWMDEHGDALKVARTLGALSGVNPGTNLGSVIALLNLFITKPVLNDFDNARLFKAGSAMITKAVMHITAIQQEHEYLILTPS